MTQSMENHFLSSVFNILIKLASFYCISENHIHVLNLLSMLCKQISFPR